jgi:hypothetical protein
MRVHPREAHDFNSDLHIVEFLRRCLQDAIVFLRLARAPLLGRAG